MLPLYRQGLTGKGKTILIVDSFGSPTIQNDLQVFDQSFGLPDPPSLNVIQPAGAVPPFDPKNYDMTGWAEETSLDVEYAHAMAPGANIVLAETPVSETEGVTGLPEMVESENFAIDHHMADVITQSFGATEATFPNAGSILKLRSAYFNALAHRVTVLASSGDAGPTDFTDNLSDLFPFRVNSWPSTDPLVTSVGGTQLHLDATGNRTAPDNVWNDTFDPNVVGDTPSPAASGGGTSAVFGRPFYQNGVADETGRSRGTPDISMSAAVNGAAILYFSFPAARRASTWSAGRARHRRCSRASWRWPTRPRTATSGCSTRRCMASVTAAPRGSTTWSVATPPSSSPTPSCSPEPTR